MRWRFSAKWSLGGPSASYGGVGLGFLLGADPALLAMVTGVALALGMGIVRRRSRQRTDTLIGAMWVIGMASGVLMIDLTPGYTLRNNDSQFQRLC